MNRKSKGVSKSQKSLFNYYQKATKEAQEKEPDIKDYDKPEKTIRIAVSGDVILTKLEVEIIDTKTFQRLRKYKQLGTSYLVYPSADHTRFEHSLGVLQKTEEMIYFIENNFHSLDHEKKITFRQKRIVRLAALLHDVANIPFGHTLEDETHVIESFQEDKKRIDFFIGPDTEIGNILKERLDPSDYELLIKVLTAKKDPAADAEKKEDIVYISDLKNNAFIVDLIKNTVCADLLDYLERDTYFCNLPLSVPDRFIRYLHIHTTENNEKRIAIRLWKRKDQHPRTALVSELIQLLETRYFLAERVYFHHAKKISSAMVAAAIWYAMHQEKRSLSFQRLFQLGDDELLSELQNSERYPIASKLATAVVERKLYKIFHAITRERIDSDKLHDHLGYLKQSFHLDSKKRADTEITLCNLSGLEIGDILIYCPNPAMNLKIAEMNVTSRKGGIEPFFKTDDKLSKSKIESILESHRNLWELQVFVRPGAVTSQQKHDLLKHWCHSFFEEYEGTETQVARRQAIRSSVEDILRDKNKEFSVPLVDEIVEEAITVKRKGEITRDYLENCLQKKRENK